MRSGFRRRAGSARGRSAHSCSAFRQGRHCATVDAAGCRSPCALSGAAVCDGCVGRFRAAAFRLDRSAGPVHYPAVMGYHLRAEAAAGPRAAGRATRRARTPDAGVGSGYRYYSPGLGRWVNRDPIGEWGGRNLTGLQRNDVRNSFDPFGLSQVQCCTQDAVDAAARRALQIALRRSDAHLIEYCGLLCCNPSTGRVRHTGPHRGWNEERRCARTGSLVERRHYCHPEYALRDQTRRGIPAPCGEEELTVGDYHTHPTGGIAPSADDRAWAAGRRYDHRRGRGSYVGARGVPRIRRFGVDPDDDVDLPLTPTAGGAVSHDPT